MSRRMRKQNVVDKVWGKEKEIFVLKVVISQWKRKKTRDKLKMGTDIENRVVVAKGEGVGGGMEWEVGVSRCKLLYIEWINNKVLLYSTGNYIQYLIINHNVKAYEKEYIYTYV